MSDQLCPVCTDPSDRGLCDRCFKRLRRDLADIIRIWSLLDDLLVPVRSGVVSGGRVKKDPPAPVDLNVVDTRDQRTSAVVAAVAGWARVLVEDLRLSTTPSDVADAAALLDRHSRWLAAQPFADEVCAEIRDASRDLRRIAHDLPPPALGTCNALDPHGNDDTCGGPMDYHESEMSVVCRRCGDSWAEADLPHLLRVMDPKRKFPVPRAYVCINYDIAPSTLRQWIRRGYVRTYHDEQVNLLDVLQRISGDG